MPVGSGAGLAVVAAVVLVVTVVVAVVCGVVEVAGAVVEVVALTVVTALVSSGRDELSLSHTTEVISMVFASDSISLAIPQLYIKLSENAFTSIKIVLYTSTIIRSFPSTYFMGTYLSSNVLLSLSPSFAVSDNRIKELWLSSV